MKLSENQILIMSTIMTEKNIAYKAFDKNMQCRGFQFEVGAHYEHNGKVEPCKSGFHACKNPLDVWNYYPINSRYAIVEIAGDVVDSGSDSKVVCSNISIVQEIALTELINHSVKYMLNECYDKLAGHNSNLAASGDYSNLAASGDYSKLAASGDYSKLVASGHYSKLAASGYNSKLVASGHNSNLAASGDYSKLAASGHYSNLATSGHNSNLAASGDYSNLATSGYYSNLAASGDYSNLAASGDYSKLAASGHNSNLAASGDGSNLAASGYNSKLAAFGYNSKLAASGYNSKLAASGKNSICMAAGYASTAQVGENGVIVLPYYDGIRTRVAVGYVGENGIEPNVEYKVNNNGIFEKVNM